MCNLFDINPTAEASLRGLNSEIRRVLRDLDKVHGIRKTDPAIVARLTAEKGDLEVVKMRWGFHRKFNPAINNARSDKIPGRMWNEAWREKRRCLIPASAFYEWTGAAGHKQTHAFEMENGNFLMAGLWEMNQEEKDVGLSFTTLTTSASEQVSKIHDRMPVLLANEDADEFLNADDPQYLLRPFQGKLKIFECENPLKMRPEDHRGPIPISMLPGF